MAQATNLNAPQAKAVPQGYCIPLGLAPGGVYQERSHQRSSGSLTPRFHPYLCSRKAKAIGGPFLWHYPSTRVDWTLSSTLPCGARTFLPRHKAASDCLSNFQATLDSIPTFALNLNS